MARRKVSQAAKPFDATTKALVETRPADWLAIVGLPGLPAEVIDADLATVTTDADRLIRFGNPPEGILHLEFVAGKSAGSSMGRRTARYNILIDDRHALPVESAVILLQKESDSPQISGIYDRRRRDGTVYLRFEYRVIRVWEMNPEVLLAGGIATLPLVPIANVSTVELPEVIQRMAERLSVPSLPIDEVQKLWAATYILLGLKYDATFASQLLKGVERMKESTTYQAILIEGREEGELAGKLTEARNLILRLGTKRLGTANSTIQKQLAEITSLEDLENLAERLLEVESWSELLNNGKKSQ